MSVASLLFIFLALKKAKNNTEENQNGVRQPLNITNYFKEGSLSIESHINKSDFSFPPNLPFLKPISPGVISESMANEIAARMGFTLKPIVANDAQSGTIMIWNNDNYSLTIILKTNNIFYSSNKGIRTLIKNTVNKQVTENEYRAIASQFLVNKVGLDNTNLKFINFTYYKVSDNIENLLKTTKENADIVQVNYSQSPSVYPIFTVNPDEPQLYVQMLKDGTPFNFKGNIGYVFQESTERYPILNYEEFLQMVPQSIIVSLNNNNVNLPDLKIGDVSNIKINKVSVVYLLDNQSGANLQPVFLSEGTASVNNIGNSVNILMYLPAFKN